LAYYRGDGVEKSEAEAVRWLRPAAEQGFAGAQSLIGYAYASGGGVAKDEAEAVLWYRRAGAQGDVEAQNNLGVMYANGLGVQKDEVEAVRWYRKAAEQGYAQAQNELDLRKAQEPPPTRVPKAQGQIARMHVAIHGERKNLAASEHIYTITAVSGPYIRLTDVKSGRAYELFCEEWDGNLHGEHSVQHRNCGPLGSWRGERVQLNDEIDWLIYRNYEDADNFVSLSPCFSYRLYYANNRNSCNPNVARQKLDAVTQPASHKK